MLLRAVASQVESEVRCSLMAGRDDINRGSRFTYRGI